MIEWGCAITWLSEIGTLVAGVSTAVLAGVAFYGLRSWRHQEKTKIKTKFLDELTDVAYEYRDAMSPLVAALKASEIGVRVHSEEESRKGNTHEFAGLKKHVQEHGTDSAKLMDPYLEKIRPLKARLNSLSIKGQVIGFPIYPEGQNALDKLLLPSSQIEAYSVVLKNPSWNYDNTSVQQTLRKVRDNVVSESIERNLDSGYSSLLEFVKQQYERSLG